jgi:histidinol phosphatase-like PHP family hydrolase
MMDDYHIHTNLTDGKMTPKEVIEQAKKCGLRTIAFTEHISNKPTYNWFDFRDSIRSMESCGIIILVGVETKVLDEKGALNVSEDVLKSSDIVLGSVHGKGHVEWLLKSKCDVIAHPQITLKNVERFINCRKILEINSKHRLPYRILDKLIIGTSNVFTFGSDAHECQDFAKAQKYFKKIQKRYPFIKFADQGYFRK